ncbi:MAG: transporter [Gemmatales bacterium]|nr:transporter [Gemmatales bacterium]MDW8175280.1 transporter [Gemmatales bacterium]
MQGKPCQSCFLFLVAFLAGGLTADKLQAQHGAMLGVPRQGRVVSASEISLRVGSANTPSQAPPAQVTLGLPRKSAATNSGPQAWSGDWSQRSGLSISPPPAASGSPSEEELTGREPRTSRPATPSVIRGAVDENYLSGVPASYSPPHAGTSAATPRGWFSHWGHDSGLGPYWEWFHIRNTFQSDHAFDEFISPVTNPFFFEDPRALTELRPVFLYQNTPKGNPLFAGGNIQMFALQGRVALNERFSVVMPKLGFIAFQPDPPSPLGDEIGFAEIILGPKLTFWRDDAANILAAFGVHFEIPAGGGDVFQSTGSGSVVPYLTFGKELLDNLHFLGAIGYRAGFDSDRSDSFFVSLHADYEFYRILYPFIEVNWFHYTSGGQVLVANFEGGDLFNFGSTGAGGEDIVTMGVGGRVKILGEQLQAGAAFEFPLTKSKDILDWRLTLDLIWRY